MLWAGKSQEYQKTISGKLCQKWSDQRPHQHWVTPIDGNDHNYCRNPDGEPNGLWCYTTDPSTRTEFCNQPPFCQEAASIDNTTEVLVISGGVSNPGREWSTVLQKYSTQPESGIDNVTVWHPLGLRCSLPSFSVSRAYHTMDSLLGSLTVCGGLWQHQFCHQLVDQDWVLLDNSAHTMWLK